MTPSNEPLEKLLPGKPPSALRLSELKYVFPDDGESSFLPPSPFFFCAATVSTQPSPLTACVETYVVGERGVSQDGGAVVTVRSSDVPRDTDHYRVTATRAIVAAPSPVVAGVKAALGQVVGGVDDGCVDHIAIAVACVLGVLVARPVGVGDGDGSRAHLVLEGVEVNAIRQPVKPCRCGGRGRHRELRDKQREGKGGENQPF